MYVCMYVCIRVCVYIYIYVYVVLLFILPIYIYTYTYTYTHTHMITSVEREDLDVLDARLPSLLAQADCRHDVHISEAVLKSGSS